MQRYERLIRVMAFRIILNMKKISILAITIIIHILGLNHANAQNPCVDFQWAKKAGGSNSDLGRSIALDQSGNTYIYGSTGGVNARFGTTTLSNSGSYISKLDPNGNFTWVKLISGSVYISDEGAPSIAVDAAGSAYITGTFGGTVNFGGISLTSTFGSDVFLAKLDSNGNFIWAEKIGGYGNNQGFSICVDAWGSAYITGCFGGYQFGSASLTSSGNYDIFIAKFDSRGNFIWVKKAGGSGYEYGKSIAADAFGNTYITGSFQGNCSFGSISLTSSGNSDIFIAKIDSIGNFIWAKKAGGTANEFGSAIAVDAAGNTYITGGFDLTASFGSTTLANSVNRKIFTSKLDSNGNFLWAKKIGGTRMSFGSSIVVDAAGNSYITGLFSGTCSFGSISLISSSNDFDVFIAKSDSNGNFLWAKKAGGTKRDVGGGIVTNGLGTIYITGWFSDIASFGNISLSAGLNNQDVFVAKITEFVLTNSAMNDVNMQCNKPITLPGNAAGYSTLQWTPPIALNSATLLNPSANPISPITYTLTVTNSCKDTIRQTVNVKIDTFTLAPMAANASISCGNSTELNANISPSSYPNINYNWTPTAGLNNTKIAKPIANPTSSTTFEVTARNICGFSITRPITIIVTPYNLSAQAENKTIFCGSSTSLSALVLPTAPSLSYKWSPTQNLNNPKSAETMVSPSINTNYTVTATTPNGCSATDSIFITVTPFTVTANASNKTINCGSTTALSAEVSPTAPALRYKWSPSKSVDNPNSANSIASPGLNTTYTVTATTPNGCSASNEVSIKVNNPNPPTVSISSNTGDFKLCSNGLVLSATTNFASYEWSNGATTPSISITQPGKYTVVAYEASGCAGTDSVEIMPIPEIATPNGSILCPNISNHNIQLIAPEGYSNYLWSNGEQSRATKISSAGLYTVSAEQGNCTYSKSVNVILSKGQAFADFSYVTQGSSISFSAISPSISFLSWQFGDGNTSFELNPIHTYKNVGTYDVLIAVTDVCGNSAERTKTITVSTLDRTELDRGTLQLYPNPSSGTLTIASENNQLFVLEVYSNLGEIILKKVLSGTDNTITIDKSGIYIIKISSSDRKIVETHKVIISI